MNAGAVLVGTAFAAAVIAAATVSVAIRDARLAVIGLLVALLAAPFLADPMADLRGVTARLAGAALGAYPLWMIYRGGQETTTGSRGGVVIDGIVAVVAALTAASAAIGWDAAGSLGSTTPGGLAAQLETFGTLLARPFLPAVAAGGALVVLAVSPVAFARDPLRLTIGLTVGLLGATLVWTGLAGPPTPFTDLCIGIALAAISAGGAVVIGASRRASKPMPASDGLRPLPPLHLPHRPDRTRRSRTERPRPAGASSMGPANDGAPRTAERRARRAGGSAAEAGAATEEAPVPEDVFVPGDDGVVHGNWAEAGDAPVGDASGDLAAPAEEALVADPPAATHEASPMDVATVDGERLVEDRDA